MNKFRRFQCNGASTQKPFESIVHFYYSHTHREVLKASKTEQFQTNNIHISKAHIQKEKETEGDLLYKYQTM